MTNAKKKVQFEDNDENTQQQQNWFRTWVEPARPAYHSLHFTTNVDMR